MAGPQPLLTRTLLMVSQPKKPAPQDLPTHRLEEQLRRAERLCDVLAWEGALIHAEEQTRRRIQDEIDTRREELLADPTAFSAVLRSVVARHLDSLDGFVKHQLREIGHDDSLPRSDPLPQESVEWPLHGETP